MSQVACRGPSIAAVANMAEDTEGISIFHVEAVGFEYHPDVITPDDPYKGSIKRLSDQEPRSLSDLQK